MVDESEDDKGREYNHIFAKEDFKDNYEESTIDSSCEQVSCITSEDMNLRFVIITKERKKISILTIFSPQLILHS